MKIIVPFLRNKSRNRHTPIEPQILEISGRNFKITDENIKGSKKRWTTHMNGEFKEIKSIKKYKC